MPGVSPPRGSPLSRAFRPGRIAAAFLFAAFAFLLAPGGMAVPDASGLWNEHVGSDATASRIVSVVRAGDRPKRTGHHPPSVL